MNLLRVTHLVLLISLLAISAATHAQLSVGARSGLNLASVSTKEDGTTTRFQIKPGINFALLLNKPLTPLLSLQIEPGFSQLGCQYEDSYSEGYYNSRRKYVDNTKLFFNYAELPVLLQLKHKLGKIDLILSAGPQLRYLLGKGKAEMTSKIYVNDVLEDVEIEKEDLTDEESLKKVEFGLSTNIGVAMPLAKFKVFVEGRYNLGLTNIAKYVESESAYNRFFAFNAGVLIPLKK